MTHPTYRPGDRVTLRTAYGDVAGTVREVYLPGPPAVYAVEAEGFPRPLVLEGRLLPAADEADAPHVVTAPTEPPGGFPVLTALALLICPADPGDLARPLELYALTVAEARRLDGCRVEAFLEAGCPCDVGDGYTVVGYEKEDGVSRSLILRGERHDIDPGDTVTAAGVLRVVEHAACTVNGVEVQGWTEVRVEQFRPTGRRGERSGRSSAGHPGAA